MAMSIFFAIDLDEKNWDKAVQIRQELANLGIFS
jgi:hypothetical protein